MTLIPFFVKLLMGFFIKPMLVLFGMIAKVAVGSVTNKFSLKLST